MMRTTGFLAGAAPITRSIARSMCRVRCRGVLMLMVVVRWIAKAQVLNLCQVLAER